jgi:5-methylcytosine-specific restriction enzyme A
MPKLRTVRARLQPSRRSLVSVQAKKADPFYLSPEWRALMREIIRVRGRRCEDTDHDDGLPREGVKLYGDHVVEIFDGGPKLDPANIMLRCGPCHGRKTAMARAARARE